MRFVEVAGNIITVVSNEELILCEKIRSNIEPFFKAKLDEREQELARQLVNRGVLLRRSKDDRVVFKYNSAEQLGDIL